MYQSIKSSIMSNMGVYITDIKDSVFAFPFVALLISIPFFIWAYRKYGSFTIMRALILYSFSFYLLTMYFLVILPLPTFSQVAAMTSPVIDLNPISFIKYYLDRRSLASIMEPVFNILIMVPMGIYLRYYFQYSLKRTILLAFLLSLFFEVTQLTALYGIYPRPYRLFSINDLMFNTLGGIVGYAIAPLFMKILPTKESIDEKSYERGRRVSLLRRIVALIIDYVILGIFSGITSYFMDKAGIKTEGFGQDMFAAVVYILVIFTYFILICYFLNGQTVGKAVVKIRVVQIKKIDSRPGFFSMLARYVILYYFIVPVFYLLLYLLGRTGTAPSAELDFILGELIVIFSACILFIVNFVYALFSRKHRLIYETMSGTEVVSTIDK